MFIGIDVGTPGTKMLLCDSEGRIVAETNFGYPLYSPLIRWRLFADAPYRYPAIAV